jgi:hypothetical protein
MLEHLEAQARDRGLLLRVQVGRPLRPVEFADGGSASDRCVARPAVG